MTIDYVPPETEHTCLKCKVLTENWIQNLSNGQFYCQSCYPKPAEDVNRKESGKALAKVLAEEIKNRFPPATVVSKIDKKGVRTWNIEGLSESVAEGLGLSHLNCSDERDPVYVYVRVVGDKTIIISRRHGA